MSVFGASLLVSIPSAALEGLDLPGSLFGAEVLRDALLAPELRCAIGLVEAACTASGTRLRFVARPEIFAHGAARAWLEARLDGARDHLTLSDGQTLRTLPGLRNHVFFHATGSLAADRARQRLLAIAPELLAGVTSQVNGVFDARTGQGWVRPPATLLRGAAVPADPGPRIAFAFPFRNVDRVAAQLAEAPPRDLPPGPLHLIPLSSRALAEAGYVRALARAIQRSAAGAAPPLLIVLPRLDAAGAELRDRIAALLAPLIATELSLPRAPTPSVLLAEADPRPEEIAGGRVTLHPSVEFWRFPPALFEQAAEVAVLGEGRLGPVRRLLEAWTGRPVAQRRAEAVLPGMEAGAPA